MSQKKKEIKKLIKRAMKAVSAEIETVRERPATDVLFGGKRREHHPPGVFYYAFESQNTSLRFAEQIKGELEGHDEELELQTVEYGDKEIVLQFPHNLGEEIEKIGLEWENDFVLRKLHSALDAISSDPEIVERIDRLFRPGPQEEDGEGDESPGEQEDGDDMIRVLDDSRRNTSQSDALRKSLRNQVLYVWGPPGTGKTSTLGFIIANYLVKGKRVLFSSNTNRAVDVGLLSALEALTAVEREHLESQVTRYGELALESPRLEKVLFEHQMVRVKEQKEKQASKLSSVLDKYLNLQKEIDHLMELGEEVPEELDREIEKLGEQMDEHGGEEQLEEKIERLLYVNEHRELEQRQLVAATLAKVCTSDLFDGMEFDAVVVDEASMASLPYLMVLAAKAKSHIVVVGDPMQLPPIALTDDAASRAFLEEDIFTYASGADSAQALFDWHDRARAITSFFDTQYRMSRDLADVISSVFYDGRLKSLPLEEGEPAGTTAVHVIDTRKYGPRLTQKSEGKGFSPVNEVHMAILRKMLKRLVLKHHVPVGEIGVIVPFRGTVYEIRRDLQGTGFEEVEVGTIHTFQGREKRVIIFDTVMTGEEQYGRRRHYSVRPFDEEKNGLSVPRLLNVAFTRSRERLVILADMDHIRRIYGDKLLGKLLDRL